MISPSLESSHREGQGHWWIAFYLQSAPVVGIYLGPSPSSSSLTDHPLLPSSFPCTLALVPPPAIPCDHVWPHSRGLQLLPKNPVQQAPVERSGIPGLSIECDGGEVSSRIFMMRWAIQNLPRLQCHMAWEKLKPTTTKGHVAGDTQTDTFSNTESHFRVDQERG